MAVCVPHVSDSKESMRMVMVKRIIRKMYHSSAEYKGTFKYVLFGNTH